MVVGFHARWAIMVLLLGLMGSTVARAHDWTALRAEELRRCESIDHAAAVGALLFNGPGKQTYYLRSICMQTFALRWRDRDACESVRERKSLLFDGSSISPASCRRQVQEAFEEDRREAAAIHDVCHIVQVRFERNGNDRGVDVEVVAQGSFGHQYQLRIVLIDAESAVAMPLIDARRHFGPSGLRIREYVGPAELSAALDGRPLDRSYRVRATLALVSKSPEAAHVFSLLPATLRSSQFETEVNLARLPPRPR